MYMGIKNHHQLPRVQNYEDAQRALGVWTNKPRRGNQIAQVHQQDDGAIAFRLYATDVVVWNPDNTVDVDNYGTATTSGFAEQFLPRGIRLNYPTTRRGHTGGANTITFIAALSAPGGIATEYGICQGDVVRFHEQNDTWVPDEDTCYEMEFPVRTPVTTKTSRELAKRYHLRDFEAWLSTAPAHLLAAGSPVEHGGCWDLDECLEALGARDFRAAASWLPTIEDTGAYGRELKPLPIRTTTRNQAVTMGSLAKLKLAMLGDAGAFGTIAAKVLPHKEFDKHMTLVRQLRNVGAETQRWGPLT